MKKCILSLFLLMLSILSFSYMNVYAEEYDPTCTYEVKAKLNKIAGEVQTSYDFVYDDSGAVVAFDISIYNITEDIYVTYQSDKSGDKKVSVSYKDTNNGTFTFRVDDINNIITYTIGIYTNKYNCADFIRKITIVKPKRNAYHDHYLCQDEELNDYYYCKEWIQSEISISEEELKKRIDQRLDKVIVTTTTKCVNCEIEAENVKNSTLFSRNKLIVMLGIGVAMLLDIFLMIRRIINIRKARL